jgi:hypothetical protein
MEPSGLMTSRITCANERNEPMNAREGGGNECTSRRIFAKTILLFSML